jgi:tape measure domain-containing protein
MATLVDSLVVRLKAEGIRQFRKEFGDASQVLEDFGLRAKGASSKLFAFGAGTGAAAAAGAVGIGKLVMAAGDMEQVRVGFRTMLGSADAAEKKLKELQDFADRSPFNFEQSAAAAQGLLAAGISADRLIPIMEGVGNATAAAGKGTEEFTGILRALGQAQNKGTIYQEELNQMNERGIPATRILARELGLSEKQLKAVGEQGIPAAKAIDALIRGFNKDFGTGMADQAKTLNGRLSTLEDTGKRLAVTLGEPLLGPVKFITKGLTDLTNMVAKSPPVVQGLVTVVGVGLVGALGLLSAASTVSGALIAWNTRELVKLARAHQGAATAATQHANATKGLNTAMGTATGFTTVGGTAVAAAAAKGGRGGRMGKFMAGAGGKGTVAALLASLGISFLPNEGTIGNIKQFVEPALNFGLTGALLGGMIGKGPHGALIGGTLGALGGLAYGAMQGRPEPAKESDELKVLREQLEELKKQNALLSGNGGATPGGLGVDVKLLPALIQRRMQADLRRAAA